MDKIKKEDLPQGVFDLYDDYAHNRIDRRKFIDKLSTYAVGGLTVGSLMSFMMPRYHENLQIMPDDPRLVTGDSTYNSPKGGGSIVGQLSRPKDAEGPLPGVVVVHENRGLNPYIADVGRRLALAGFITLAPDALTPLGGYPGNDDEGRELQNQRDRNGMLEDFIAAFDYLKSSSGCTGKVGVIGFCFGGWISNMMAVRLPDLAAAVPFYGMQPPEEMVKDIHAPLLLHFAGLDTRVNEGWPAYEKSLKENNKDYTAYVYPGVNHGFHNDSTPRYDKESAELAWIRTVDFLTERLKDGV